MLPAPIKFPVVAGDAAHCKFQRPAKNTTINNLFQRFHIGSQSIKSVFEAEPGVQPEHSPVGIHSFHHFFAFADGSGHWFFAPDIFPCLCSFHRHESVPVRRSGDVHNIYFGQSNQFPEIVKGFHRIVNHVFSSVQMQLFHITNSNHAGSLIGNVSAPHSPNTNNPLGELIRWRQITVAAQHMTWHDGYPGTRNQCAF